MRSIGSDADREKKRQRNTFYMSLFIFVVLVLSTLGFAFLSGNRYNGDEESQNAGEENQAHGYSLDIGNGESIDFATAPQDVRWIPIEINSTIQSYLGQPLYMSVEDETVASEIAYTLGLYASRIQKACYGHCKEDLPEKDCSENLIVYNPSIDFKVEQEGNCIFIDGDIGSVDAFLFRIFGVN